MLEGIIAKWCRLRQKYRHTLVSESDVDVKSSITYGVFILELITQRLLKQVSYGKKSR